MKIISTALRIDSSEMRLEGVVYVQFTVPGYPHTHNSL